MERRNGSLDLLRGLAIALVLNCHIYNAFEPQGPLGRYFGIGGRGVDLFFILSGWLLGHQLLIEREKTGTIQIRRFWLRRAFRIFPAYYVVLALTVAQAIWNRGVTAFDPIYWVFIQNYLPEMPYFAVSWSLCVEEHFYLVIGPVLVLMGRTRWAGPGVCALLVVPTVCRLLGWYHTESMFETHVRFDQCATGVALAWVCVRRPDWWHRLRRLAPIFALVGLGVVGYLVFVGGLPVSQSLYPTVDITAWTLVFAAWVLLANSSPRLATAPNSLAGRYLANRAFALYLLHRDAIAVVAKLGELPIEVRFVLVWVVALLGAEVLYRLVERPGMRMREWFAITRQKVPK